MWVIVLSDGDGPQRNTEVKGPWSTKKEAQDRLVEAALTLGTKWVSGNVLEVKEIYDGAGSH